MVQADPPDADIARMRRPALRIALLSTASAVVLAGIPVVAAGQDVADGHRRTERVVTFRATSLSWETRDTPRPLWRREKAVAPQPNVLVRITRDTAVHARPGGGPVVGVVPASSKYYKVPTVAWVQRISQDGRFGRVVVPYASHRRSGWIPLRGLRRLTTWVAVLVDLSEHRVTVERRGKILFRAPAATGAPSSPTPTGRYFVTDRVPFSGGSLGSFAFGISGIQPNLPAGWTGGNQLAIHGTSDPSSIGHSVSAGCVRVSEATLSRLKSLLRLGTPVVIQR